MTDVLPQCRDNHNFSHAHAVPFDSAHQLTDLAHVLAIWLPAAKRRYSCIALGSPVVDPLFRTGSYVPALPIVMAATVALDGKFYDLLDKKESYAARTAVAALPVAELMVGENGNARSPTAKMLGRLVSHL